MDQVPIQILIMPKRRRPTHGEREIAGERTSRGKTLGAGTWDVGLGIWESGTWETDPLP